MLVQPFCHVAGLLVNRRKTLHGSGVTWRPGGLYTELGALLSGLSLLQPLSSRGCGCPRALPSYSSGRNSLGAVCQVLSCPPLVPALVYAQGESGDSPHVSSLFPKFWLPFVMCKPSAYSGVFR